MLLLDVSETEKGTSKRLIHSQARNIIKNVSNFFDEQKAHGSWMFPIDQATQLAATATGVSTFLIKSIRKEMQAAGNKPLQSPKKKDNKPPVNKIELDDMDQGILRRTVHETYIVDHQIPTVKLLLKKMQQKIDYKGHQETLRKQLHKIGFSFKKCIDKRKFLLERSDIVVWRSQYLRRLKENDTLENPRPITYLDETYIHPSYGVSKCWQSEEEPGVYKQNRAGERYIIVHAGGEYGFVPNALLVFKSHSKSSDYHDDMNHENFIKWLKTQLIPNLPPNGLVVMDNAPYHSVQINKAPTQATRKNDILTWLHSQQVPATSEMRKAELLQLVKLQQHKKTYYVDELLKEHGHTVVRLPPYHCELNPIEQVWSLMKHKVAMRNVEQKNANTETFLKEAFAEITPEYWKKYCEHTKKVREEFWQKDGLLDEVVEEIIFSVNTGSSSEEIESGSELSDDNEF